VALPPKASSGETAAGSFWDITLSGMTCSTLQVTRVVPSPGPLPCRNHQRVGALTSARHCDDVLDRMHDPLDLICQHLECVAHLLDVGVPVIDAALATDDVTEAALGDVGIDAVETSASALCAAGHEASSPASNLSRRRQCEVQYAAQGRDGCLNAAARHSERHMVGEGLCVSQAG
jgi:hypothetical protein